MLVVLDRQLGVDLGYYDQILLLAWFIQGLCHMSPVHLPVRTGCLVIEERRALSLREVSHDSRQKRLRLGVSFVLVQEILVDLKIDLHLTRAIAIVVIIEGNGVDSTDTHVDGPISCFVGGVYRVPLEREVLDRFFRILILIDTSLINLQSFGDLHGSIFTRQ